MTLFPRKFEEIHGITSSPESHNAEIPDTLDTARASVTWIILNEEGAESIMPLPEWAEAKIFGTFEAFEAAILWNNPTYDLHTNEHI